MKKYGSILAVILPFLVIVGVIISFNLSWGFIEYDFRCNNLTTEKTVALFDMVYENDMKVLDFKKKYDEYWEIRIDAKINGGYEDIIEIFKTLGIEWAE